MPLHGLGWLGDGRDVYIENQENRFADRNALGKWMGETTWINRDNSFQGTPPNRAADKGKTHRGILLDGFG
jgi:hypothetical protein